MRRRALLGSGDGQVVPQMTLGYVDGMIMLLDGIENTLTGHSSSATELMDLSNNGNVLDFPTTNNPLLYNWQNNHLSITNGSTNQAAKTATGIKINDIPIVSLSEYTIEMRIRMPNVQPKVNANLAYFSSVGVYPQMQFILLNNTTPRISINLPAYSAMAKPGTYNLGWFTISAAFYGLELKIYFDGIYANMMGGSSILQELLSKYFSLGGVSFDNTHNGCIDVANVRIYPIALSAQQILDNYNNDINRGLI